MGVVSNCGRVADSSSHGWALAVQISAVEFQLAGVVQAGRADASNIRDQVGAGRDRGAALGTEPPVGLGSTRPGAVILLGSAPLVNCTADAEKTTFTAAPPPVER